MKVEIRAARDQDGELIRKIQVDLKRPVRADYHAGEYLIAWHGNVAIGCAATSPQPGGGYFYGLAVKREWQRKGIGGQLMQARLEGLRAVHAGYAVALVMFWNSRFFRAHGFAPFKRGELQLLGANHSDLTNPVFLRSAVMLRGLDEPS
jgi:N-acetylglutamate synthase-like GNAT family acetyltransferase